MRKLPILLLLIIVSPLSALTHTVESGQTLYSLAREFGVSVDELMDANGISDPRSLRVGQVLTIPGTAGSPATGTHVVESGETLYGLARQYGITVDELRRLNDMSPEDVLVVGRKLIVPGAGSTVPNPEPDPDPEPTPQPQPEPRNPGGDTVTWPHDGQRVQLTGNLKGIEILGKRGDDVVAVSRGKVVLVQPFRTYGKLVIVESDDHYIYIYGGCDETLVTTGDEVQAGMRLGTLGTGPGGVSKVYFAVHKDSRHIDPALAPRL